MSHAGRFGIAAPPPLASALTPRGRPPARSAQFLKPLERFLTIAELRAKSSELPEHNDLISQPRLCVFPAPKDEWDILMGLPSQPPPASLAMPETPGAAGR